MNKLPILLIIKLNVGSKLRDIVKLLNGIIVHFPYKLIELKSACLLLPLLQSLCLHLFLNSCYQLTQILIVLFNIIVVEFDRNPIDIVDKIAYFCYFGCTLNRLHMFYDVV